MSIAASLSVGLIRVFTYTLVSFIRTPATRKGPGDTYWSLHCSYVFESFFTCSMDYLCGCPEFHSAVWLSDWRCRHSWTVIGNYTFRRSQHQSFSLGSRRRFKDRSQRDRPGAARWVFLFQLKKSLSDTRSFRDYTANSIWLGLWINTATRTIR